MQVTITVNDLDEETTDESVTQSTEEDQDDIRGVS